MCPCVILFPSPLIPSDWSTFCSESFRNYTVELLTLDGSTIPHTKAWMCFYNFSLTICIIFFKRLNPVTLYTHNNVYYLKHDVYFQRSISENSLVAMDFSGHKSRVIENPSEALSVAVEEGLSWRVGHWFSLWRHVSLLSACKVWNDGAAMWK